MSSTLPLDIKSSLRSSSYVFTLSISSSISSALQNESFKASALALSGAEAIKDIVNAEINTISYSH